MSGNRKEVSRGVWLACLGDCYFNPDDAVSSQQDILKMLKANKMVNCFVNASEREHEYTLSITTDVDGQVVTETFKADDEMAGMVMSNSNPFAALSKREKFEHAFRLEEAQKLLTSFRHIIDESGGTLGFDNPEALQERIFRAEIMLNDYVDMLVRGETPNV